MAFVRLFFHARENGTQAPRLLRCAGAAPEKSVQTKVASFVITAIAMFAGLCSGQNDAGAKTGRAAFLKHLSRFKADTALGNPTPTTKALYEGGNVSVSLFPLPASSGNDGTVSADAIFRFKAARSEILDGRLVLSGVSAMLTGYPIVGNGALRTVSFKLTSARADIWSSQLKAIGQNDAPAASLSGSGVKPAENADAMYVIFSGGVELRARETVRNSDETATIRQTVFRSEEIHVFYRRADSTAPRVPASVVLYSPVGGMAVFHATGSDTCAGGQTEFPREGVLRYAGFYAELGGDSGDSILVDGPARFRTPSWAVATEHGLRITLSDHTKMDTTGESFWRMQRAADKCDVFLSATGTVSARVNGDTVTVSIASGDELSAVSMPRMRVAFETLHAAISKTPAGWNLNSITVDNASTTHPITMRLAATGSESFDMPAAFPADLDLLNGDELKDISALFHHERGSNTDDNE